VFHKPKYKSIADTIVQLIRRFTSRVIVPSQPIRSESDKNGLAALFARQEESHESRR
jgi:hypothetical protein